MTNTPSFAAGLEEERVFFATLRSELAKVALHYAECEASLSEAYSTLTSAVEAYAVDVVGAAQAQGQTGQEGQAAARRQTAKQLLTAAVRLTSSLIQLENYAVLNYCAFAKIMKKKEKVTGVTCKKAYMQVCVNVQEFAHYPRLLRMLSGAERLYSLLIALQPEDSAISVDMEDAARLADLRDVQASSSLQRQKELAEAAELASMAGSIQSPRGLKRKLEEGGGSAAAEDEKGGRSVRRKVEGTAGLTGTAAQTGNSERPDERGESTGFRRSDSELDIAKLLADNKA